ncbi:hypothetical protein ACQ4PT_064453 [Festuca glaucescens]
MATRGSAAPLRMFESHSFIVVTPPMENTVKALSTTALVGSLSEKREVSPDAAARALERELGIPWANVVVTNHSPEDFLIRFDFPSTATSPWRSAPSRAAASRCPSSPGRRQPGAFSAPGASTVASPSRGCRNNPGRWTPPSRWWPAR